MTEMSYHNEVLRKARLLERKCDAQKRLGIHDQQKSDLTPYESKERRNDGVPSKADEESLKKLHRAIHKDLKSREKVLRDHNLYMGPMSAFEDLYPKLDDIPKFKSSQYH